jgi:tetratricopeptide (TPR) repeat protein
VAGLGQGLVWDIHEQCEDALTVRAEWEEIIALWRKTGDRAGEAILVSDWGQYAVHHGNYVEAQEYLLNSLKIYEELGWKGHYAYQTLRELGHAARALQEYDQALVYSTNCANLAEKLGWYRFVPDCSLGFTYLYIGDPHRAEAFVYRCAANSAEQQTVMTW